MKYNKQHYKDVFHDKKSQDTIEESLSSKSLLAAVEVMWKLSSNFAFRIVYYNTAASEIAGL